SLPCRAGAGPTPHQPNIKKMLIADLVFAPAVYPRRHLDEGRVAVLIDLLEAGVVLPPIRVQRGTDIILNGEHRVEAYKRPGRAEILVEEVDVADEDLLAYACQQDVAAALPYTQEDRRDVARRLYAAGKGIAIIVDLVKCPRQTVRRWLSK